MYFSDMFKIVLFSLDFSILTQSESNFNNAHDALQKKVLRKSR